MIDGRTSRSRALSRSARDPHTVYRYYDSDDRLLYVGCTANLKRRIYQHQHATETATLASRVLSLCMTRVEQGETFGDRGAAQDAEAQAIRAERPLLNHQGSAPGWMVQLEITHYLTSDGIDPASVGLTRCAHCDYLRPYRSPGDLCSSCRDPEYRALVDAERQAAS